MATNLASLQVRTRGYDEAFLIQADLAQDTQHDSAKKTSARVQLVPMTESEGSLVADSSRSAIAPLTFSYPADDGTGLVGVNATRESPAPIKMIFVKSGDGQYDFHTDSDHTFPALAPGFYAQKRFSGLTPGKYSLQMSVTLATSTGSGDVGIAIENAAIIFEIKSKPSSMPGVELDTKENLVKVTLSEEAAPTPTDQVGVVGVAVDITEPQNDGSFKNEHSLISYNGANWFTDATSLAQKSDCTSEAYEESGDLKSVTMSNLTIGDGGDLTKFAVVDVAVQYFVTYLDTWSVTGGAAMSTISNTSSGNASVFTAGGEGTVVRGILTDIATKPVLEDGFQGVTDTATATNSSVKVRALYNPTEESDGWSKASMLIMYAASSQDLIEEQISDDFNATLSTSGATEVNQAANYIRVRNNSTPLGDANLDNGLGGGVMRKVISKNAGESYGSADSYEQVSMKNTALYATNDGVYGDIHIALVVATQQGESVDLTGDSGASADVYAIGHDITSSGTHVTYSTLGLWTSSGIQAALAATSLSLSVQNVVVNDGPNKFGIRVQITNVNQFTSKLNTNNLEAVAGNNGKILLSSGASRFTSPNENGTTTNGNVVLDRFAYSGNSAALNIDSGITIPTNIHAYAEIPDLSISMYYRPKSWDASPTKATLGSAGQRIFSHDEYTSAQKVFGDVPDLIPVASCVGTDKNGYILYRLRARNSDYYGAKASMYSPAELAAEEEGAVSLTVEFTNHSDDNDGQVRLGDKYDLTGEEAVEVLKNAVADEALYQDKTVAPYTFKTYLTGSSDADADENQLNNIDGCYMVTKVPLDDLEDDTNMKFGARLKRVQGSGEGNALNADQNLDSGVAYDTLEATTGTLNRVTVGLSDDDPYNSIKSYYQAAGYDSEDTNGVKLEAVLASGNATAGAGAAAGGADVGIFWAGNVAVDGVAPENYQPAVVADFIQYWGAAGSSDTQRSELINFVANADATSDTPVDATLQVRRLVVVDGARAPAPVGADGGPAAGLESYYVTHKSTVKVTNPARESWTTQSVGGGADTSNDLISGANAGEHLDNNSQIEITMKRMNSSDFARTPAGDMVFIGVYLDHDAAVAAAQASLAEAVLDGDEGQIANAQTALTDAQEAMADADPVPSADIYDGEKLADEMEKFCTARGTALPPFNGSQNQYAPLPARYNETPSGPFKFSEKRSVDDFSTEAAAEDMIVRLDAAPAAQHLYKIVAFRYIKAGAYREEGNSTRASRLAEETVTVVDMLPAALAAPASSEDGETFTSFDTLKENVTKSELGQGNDEFGTSLPGQINGTLLRITRTGTNDPLDGLYMVTNISSSRIVTNKLSGDLGKGTQQNLEAGAAGSAAFSSVTIVTKTPAVPSTVGNTRLTQALNSVFDADSHTVGDFVDAIESGQAYVSADQLSNISGTIVRADHAAGATYTVDWQASGARVRYVLLITDLDDFSTGNAQGAQSSVDGLFTKFIWNADSGNFVKEDGSEGLLAVVNDEDNANASPRIGAGAFSFKCASKKVNGYAAVLVTEFGETGVIMSNI